MLWFTLYLATGIATCTNWLNSFVVTLTFQRMSDAFGMDVVFWIYGGNSRDFLAMFYVRCASTRSNHLFRLLYSLQYVVLSIEMHSRLMRLIY